MRPLHELMLEAVAEERHRLTTRRRLLSGSAKVAAGSAVAMAALGTPALTRLRASAQDLASDIDVLNYALTLEHLENALYRDGISQFTFGSDPFGNSIDFYLALIGEHEAAHVATLSQVITDLGGEPAIEQSYDFGIADAGSFLSIAQALENTGVSAYYGAGASLQNPDLLTAAGAIVAVEARHAAYLNFLNGEIPFPDAFEATLTPEEAMEIAGPFITAGEGGTSEAATPEA